MRTSRAFSLFPQSEIIVLATRRSISSRAVSRARFLAVVLGSLWAHSALAAPPTISVPVDPESYQSEQGAGPFGFLQGLRRNGYLFGDMWGLRPALSKYGISFAVLETSEVLGNATGGVRTGAAYDGLTQAALQLDTSRAFGWRGGTLNVSGLWIHGNNLSADNLLTLQTASGIQSDRATRLWEVWYQQKLRADERMDLRVGLQSLDQEFMVSQNALAFMNTMFGWPMLPSADMPGGGPAYPLSALGVRLRARPLSSVTFLAGAFNGTPAPDAASSQQSNPHGLDIGLSARPLVIAELQWTYPSLGAMVTSDGSEPMPRVYKIGAWYDGERFADQRFDSAGGSLAAPTSSGVARAHRGNYAIYAVADQMLWQQADEQDRTLNAFVRVMGTPLTDRNLIDFSLNAGITLREPFMHRDDDVFGIALGYAHVSSRAAALDRDTAAMTGQFTPQRGGELFVETTYSYQVAPWLQLQPDVQVVFNPGGGIANPSSPSDRVGTELVAGLRTNIVF
jgi:porin